MIVKMSKKNSWKCSL